MFVENKAGEISRKVLTRDATLSDKYRFNIGAKVFTQQFSKFYEARLKAVTANLTKVVRQKWGSDIAIKQVCDVVTDQTCVVLGTTFKQMQLQPNILTELGVELNMPVQPVLDNYTSDDDMLFLEDMVQRIVLTGDICVDEFVTGVSIAVKGMEDKNNLGHFIVEDICYPTMKLPTVLRDIEDVDVLFVSGLEFGGSKFSSMATQLLVDYVGGSLGNEEEASKICRVVIAGNSVSSEVNDKEQHYKAKYLTKSVVAGTVDAMKDVASFLKLLTKTVPVTIMSGENDPSNVTMPQQPLHPCMLADESGCLETSPNPYECDITGVHILGHSGQPCNNIKKYSKLESSADIMKRCLKWAHIAPTAPDTLASYPYTDEDPFIIESCPHIFFAGNQSHPQADYYSQGDGQRCLCLAIPKFSETGLCIKVNLKTLDWEPVSLSADSEQ